MKEVNESKAAKEKADAEAKAKAEQEAAAAAAAQQQAQASQSQSAPRRQTPHIREEANRNPKEVPDPVPEPDDARLRELVVLRQYGRSLAGMVRARAIRRGHRLARKRSGVVIREKRRCVHHAHAIDALHALHADAPADAVDPIEAIRHRRRDRRLTTFTWLNAVGLYCRLRLAVFRFLRSGCHGIYRNADIPKCRYTEMLHKGVKYSIRNL